VHTQMPLSRLGIWGWLSLEDSLYFGEMTCFVS